jgi:thioredoxin reductase (NADPH)
MAAGRAARLGNVIAQACQDLSARRHEISGLPTELLCAANDWHVPRLTTLHALITVGLYSGGRAGSSRGGFLNDVLIIGAGLAGLTAGMYCRMRKLTVTVIDAGRPGGQLVSLYGDKPVHDWPGHVNVVAMDLAKQLLDHATELGVEIIADRKVDDLARTGEGFEVQARDVLTGEAHRHEARGVIIAIGGGAYEPRKLRVPGEDQLTEESLTYRMPDRTRAAGRDVVVVGGGDSGLESAQSAHEAGGRVTIVQVLDRFTGMETNIEKVDAMNIPRHFNTRVRSLEIEDGRLEAVVAQTKGQPEPLRLPCDYLVVNIGQAVNLEGVKRWGVEVEGSHIKVDGHMRTSVEGIFACGDVVTYDGKYKLLLTAASEGCVAANTAYQHVRKPTRVTMTDLYS